jgi:hypothetical protein
MGYQAGGHKKYNKCQTIGKVMCKLVEKTENEAQFFFLRA